MKELTKKLPKENMATEEEPLDETFEIISEKEKLWKGFLVAAETNYLNAEAAMLQNKQMIDLAKIEIQKEAAKNAKQ